MTKQKRWHWQCDGEMSPHGQHQHQHHWWPACHDGSFSLVTRTLETLLQLHWGGVITASTAFHFHSVTQPGEDLGIKSQASLHGDRNVVTEQIYLHGSALWLVRGAQVVPRTGSYWLGGSRDWTSGGAGLGFPLKSMKVRQQRWAELEPPLAPWPGPGPLRASPPMWSHYWNTIPSTMQTGLKCNKYTLYRRHDFSSGLFMSKQIRFTCVHKFTF